MWKWIVGVVVVLGVLAVGGALAVLQSPLGAKLRGGQGMVATPVALASVERGDLVRTVSAPGSVEPRTRVQISSQVSAKVIALPFREGDEVKAGDVVIRLDPQALTALLESARASERGEQARLTGAEANLINARLNYERLGALYETGDVTRAELEAAEAQFLGAQSNKQVIEHSIEIARARIEEAQKDLDNTTIAAPMDGVVTALNAEIGETVIVGTTNNPGSVIMEIADLSEMLVKAQIDESNIAPVKVGQQATVFINAYPDREFEGEVRQIGLKRQVAADGTGYFEVEILVRMEEGERLLSGLTASVDVAVEEFFDVLRVPSQCVLDRRVEDLPKEVRDASGHINTDKAHARVVYRMESGKAKAVPVRVGASDLTHTVIEAGLSPGDRVISGPYRLLGGENPIKHDQAVRDQDVPLPDSKEAKDAAAKAADGKVGGEGEGAGEDEPRDDGADEGDDEGEAREVAAP